MRYIGSKRNLLPNIEAMLDRHVDGSERTFVDLFAGTNAVATHFASKYQVVTNDIMYFSYALARGTLGVERPLEFRALRQIGIDNPLEYLSTAKIANGDTGYATQQYSPAGDAGRMYFTIPNARRIDFIRDTIEDWKVRSLLTESEFYYLLASLLSAVPSVSNITGTYGAYLKKWDKRANKQLILEPPSPAGVSWKGGNVQFNQDALALLPRISGADIAYIDTPYNTRQYPTNYHVLENIAQWKKPRLHGVTGQPDFADELSDFASKRKAREAMRDLLNHLFARHVLLSYSTDGIIPTEELEEIIDEAAEGDVDKMEFPYRKYKSKVYTDKGVNELLYYFHPKAYEQISVGSRNIATVFQPLSVSHQHRSKKQYAMTSTVGESECGGIIKSPLNYVGGKYRLLPQILPLFPKNISTFLDLFCGSATVGINATAQRVIFNDVNSRIIELFQRFQMTSTEEVLNRIYEDIQRFGLSKTNQEGFLDFRNEYNRHPDPIDLYVLVAYSFNYQFRFNSAMEYNNPFGRNRSSFSPKMKNNLIRFMARLHTIDATFISQYFSRVDTKGLDQYSFVYADPPYLITTGSYNDGTRCFGDWTEIQDRELRGMLDSLNERGIRFAMSNVLVHKGQKNRELAEWARENRYHVHHLLFNYNNASYNTGRGASDEVLITNY